MSEILSVYSDGGLILSSPSALGFTWAWVHVGPNDHRVEEASGVVIIQPPKTWRGEGTGWSLGLETWPRPRVASNESEFVALIRGIEALPLGWAGRVCSDNVVALGRVFNAMSLRAVPREWVERGHRALSRIDLAACTKVQHDGHPNVAQLKSGIGKCGNAASIHQVRCDTLCTEQARAFVDRYGHLEYVKAERTRLAEIMVNRMARRTQRLAEGGVPV